MSAVQSPPAPEKTDVKTLIQNLIYLYVDVMSEVSSTQKVSAAFCWLKPDTVNSVTLCETEEAAESESPLPAQIHLEERKAFICESVWSLVLI